MAALYQCCYFHNNFSFWIFFARIWLIWKNAFEYNDWNQHPFITFWGWNIGYLKNSDDSEQIYWLEQIFMHGVNMDVSSEGKTGHSHFKAKLSKPPNILFIINFCRFQGPCSVTGKVNSRTKTCRNSPKVCYSTNQTPF